MADFSGLAQGLLAGIPQGIQMGQAIQQKKEQQLRSAMLKLEMATKYTKDPNVPEGFKLSLWNKSVLPTLKELFPESGDIPPLAAWTDSAAELSKSGFGIFRGVREGKYLPLDGLGMLANLQTSYAGSAEEAKARIEPFSKIISDDIARDARAASRLSLRDRMTPQLINLRAQISRELEVALPEQTPALQAYLSDIDTELYQRGLRGPVANPPASTPKPQPNPSNTPPNTSTPTIREMALPLPQGQILVLAPDGSAGYIASTDRKAAEGEGYKVLKDK